MKKRLSIISAALLIIGAAISIGYRSLTPRNPPRTAQQIIAKEGQLRFAYDGSWYTLRNDDTFDMAPLGISGEAITGKWATSDGQHFVVDGRWHWINGQYMPNDFRTMPVTIAPVTGDKEIAGFDKEEVYECEIIVGASVKKATPTLTP